MSRPIDADVLISWLKKAGSYLKSLENSKVLTKAIGVIIDHVEAMPTIEQPKWINCEERLPDEGGIYLVCIDFDVWDKKHKVVCIEQFIEQLNGWFCDGVKITGITHWMPLPQPPKGDE